MHLYESRFAKSCVKIGMQPLEVTGMIGFNSAELLFTLQGTWISGCVPAGVYTTNSPDACQYVLNHSEAKICVCQGGKNAAKIASIRESLPQLKAIIVYWPEDGVPNVEDNQYAKVYTWNDWMNLGNDIADEVILNRAKAIKPGNCATLIYTSGTTGNPKAVMCSHDSCVYNSLNLDYYAHFNLENRFVSFLPMNHIAAQFIDVMMPTCNKITVYIADPDALRGTLINTLRKARPTFFLAVPRVWEKFAESIRSSFAHASCFKKMFIKQAMKIGFQTAITRQYGKKFHKKMFYNLAKRYVFDPAREMLGLDKARTLVVSAAPVTDDTLNFFARLDMPIYDILGQSEGTAPICFQTDTNQEWRMYTAGRPLRGIMARTDPNTQEVQFKGRLVMMGYLKMPAETASTIDDEGWLHTGDQAVIDQDGFIKITGRLKELIVTAGGENVAPVPIENKILELCPIMANCVVVGDKRKFLSALVSLKTVVNPMTGEPSQNLIPTVISIIKANGGSATTVAEAKNDPAVNKMIQEAIDGYNKVAISRAQEIRKWYLMERDLSLSHGELTATLKLKRNVVHQHYEKQIDSLYV